MTNPLDRNYTLVTIHNYTEITNLLQFTITQKLQTCYNSQLHRNYTLVTTHNYTEITHLLQLTVTQKLQTCYNSQ
jgi:hypothetical protein